MRTILLSLGALTLSLAALYQTPVASAASYEWTGASGVDSLWSRPANWNPSGPPGQADEARFFDTGATNDVLSVDNVVGADTSIGALWYGQTNGFHNTLINAGVTLTLSNNLTAGTETTNTIDQLVVDSISGNGVLRMANTNASIVARQLHTDAGTHRATLDLSGLDSFNGTLGRILVGFGGSTARRALGTVILAKTNTITLSGANPQILVGDNSGNNNGNGSVSFLTLGQQNTINANTIRIGGQKQQGNFSFNPSFASPSLKLRASDGTSRITELDFGDNGAQGASGNPTTGTINWNDGTVDVRADVVYLGRGQTGTGTGGTTGTLTLGAGTFDANTVEVGYQNGSTAVGVVNGTVNVNNNGLFGSGAKLIVNSTLRLARSAGSAAVVNGTLNVNSGTVLASTIVGGGGNSSINVTTGTLSVTNTAGTASAALGNLSVSDATIQLAANVGTTNIVVTNLTTGGAGNLISISSVSGLFSYPATNTLIQYSGAIFGSFNFTLSLPGTYQGYLADNSASSSVDLVITNGPAPSRLLTWDGVASGNWDTSSANWRVNGLPTTYNQGDFVRFDDAALGTTAINLTTTLTPGALTISNSAKTYTFSGSGKLSGSIALVKQDPGTFILANSGINDWSGGTVIAGGTLQLGNGGTAGSLPTGAISDDGTLAFNRSDDLTLANTISGAGGVTKNAGNTVTLDGANTFNGAVNVTQGTLRVNNNSALGTTNGGTTIAWAPPWI